MTLQVPPTQDQLQAKPFEINKSLVLAKVLSSNVYFRTQNYTKLVKVLLAVIVSPPGLLRPAPQLFINLSAALGYLGRLTIGTEPTFCWQMQGIYRVF